MTILICTLAAALALAVAIYAAFLIRKSIGKKRVSAFMAQVGGALSDLDMQATMLPIDLKKTFLYESYEKFMEMGNKADARALALDLFVRFFMAYSAQMTPYERIALIERSIRKARQWQEAENIEEISDEFVETVKEFFIDELAACQMPRADRSATVSRVMSL